MGWLSQQYHHFPYPIGSMYGIFTYIYHKFKPNVGKYTIHGSYGYMSCWKKKRCQHFAWLARLGPVRPLTLDETLQDDNSRGCRVFCWPCFTPLKRVGVCWENAPKVIWHFTFGDLFEQTLGWGIGKDPAKYPKNYPIIASYWVWLNRFSHKLTCKSSSVEYGNLTIPEDPCMVYLPTFPIKINQM